MTVNELVKIIKDLEDEKKFLEYRLQNYKERLQRLLEHNRESEERNTPIKEKNDFEK